MSASDVRTLFRRFAEYTTFHGVNRIISSKLMIGRLVWLCIVMTSFCMCIRQIYILSVQFSRYVFLNMSQLDQVMHLHELLRLKTFYNV